MKTRVVGKRYPLLFYRRSIDWIWQTSLPLGILAVAAQLLSGRTWPYIGAIPSLPSPLDELLFFGGILMVIFAALVYLARSLAYAQPRKDHLRISTPFTQIKISYRRVRSVHPTNISQLYPLEKLHGSTRSFLEPFFGKTAVVVELLNYPMARSAMKFFMGAHSLLPNGTGLVLMVPDWMTLSTELDTILGKWRYT